MVVIIKQSKIIDEKTSLKFNLELMVFFFYFRLFPVDLKWAVKLAAAAAAQGAGADKLSWEQ